MFAVLLWFPATGQATVVRLQTISGIVDVQLYDTQATETVANFLGYVNSGAYNNAIIHRSVSGFVIQSGGYIWDDAVGVKAIATSAPVTNEFSASRSNLRGTIAMAKVGGNPNSATSQWFINLADNSANLDAQNGGFTVFGRVMGNGMSVVDVIAALRIVNAGGDFSALPVTSVPASGQISGGQLALVISAAVLPGAGAASDSDRVFNYLEAAYPQYVAPANPPTALALGYTYRHYESTRAYIGTANGMLYYLGPAFGNNTILPLGELSEWLNTAAQAGY